MKLEYDVCIVGGGGHVGLPLAIAFACQNLNVIIYDINPECIHKVNKGKMPFLEKDAETNLNKVINKKLRTSLQPEVISQSEYVVIVIGTPVDEHLNPDFNVINKFLKNNLKYFNDNQVLILRSTLFPGTTHKVKEFIEKNNLKLGVAFCPERIAEGKAMEELYTLPQIISAFSPNTIKKVKKLFLKLTKDILILKPIEAELAKLFSNSWRYIQFAISNQFYMICEELDIDFYNIHKAMTYKYPRTANFPKAGFAAGPCLLKDTMQLAAFNNNNFFLGHSAMLINEGLPNYIVMRLKKIYNLHDLKIGILGMAFKAESDDKRESLSYKLKKILEFEAKAVYCTDEYIKDDSFFSLQDVIEKSDILIIGVPHSKYKSISTDKRVFDIWNILRKG